MGILQVSGDRPGAGKTSLAGALLIRSMAGGKRAGYYKPYSKSADNDSDVSFISQTLLAGFESPGVPGPRSIPEDTGAFLNFDGTALPW